MHPVLGPESRPQTSRIATSSCMRTSVDVPWPQPPSSVSPPNTVHFITSSIKSSLEDLILFFLDSSTGFASFTLLVLPSTLPKVWCSTGILSGTKFEPRSAPDALGVRLRDCDRNDLRSDGRRISINFMINSTTWEDSAWKMRATSDVQAHLPAGTRAADPVAKLCRHRFQPAKVHWLRGSSGFKQTHSLPYLAAKQKYAEFYDFIVLRVGAQVTESIFQPLSSRLFRDHNHQAAEGSLEQKLVSIQAVRPAGAILR
ncbi:hypothetical protein B0H13DRAFT_1887762 [Mycena leptocephala]|nr:hypothetical protein B0H13DRAFT_1887762 [Mycena leptocephala]